MEDMKYTKSMRVTVENEGGELTLTLTVEATAGWDTDDETGEREFLLTDWEIQTVDGLPFGSLSGELQVELQLKVDRDIRDLDWSPEAYG
jgi:hypothetical protein